MGIRAEITDALLARIKEELDKGTGEIGTNGEKLYGRISALHNFQSSLQIEASVRKAAVQLKHMTMGGAKPAKAETSPPGPSRDGILWRQF